MDALCNLDFLLAKLQGISVAEVLQDFNMALDMYKEDDELRLISNTVKIGVPALRENHYNIINELIGRLKESTTGRKNLEKLVNSAVKMATLIDSLPLVPYNQCLPSPGGALISQLLAHTGKRVISHCMHFSIKLDVSSLSSSPSAFPKGLTINDLGGPEEMKMKIGNEFIFSWR